MIDAGFAVSRRLARAGLWPDSSRSRGLLARLAGDRYSAEIHGAQIGGSLVDHGPYLRWLSSGGPHPFQLELFLGALEPGALVADVGAHIGSHTVLAARRVGPEGSVVAIEPDESNLSALRENVAANGVAERVELIEAVASDRSGTTSLYEADDRASRALSSLSPRPGVAPLEVRCVTLDDVLAGRRVDVAKIDVEGAESLVLDGARETLARSSGATLFVECHPAALQRLGTSATDWLAALHEAGSVELIDENRRRLLPATEGPVSRVPDDHAFNVRWTLS